MARCILGILIVSSWLLTACDPTDVDPFGFDPFDSGDQAYSVYGFLDQSASTQLIRVIPLRRRFNPPATADDAVVDAVVVTNREDASDSQIWSQQIVEFTDGSFGAVFTRDLQPLPGDVYNLVVRRSDNSTTTATTAVPPTLQAEIVEPIITSSEVVQSIYWPAEHPISTVLVTYRAGPPPRPQVFQYDYGLPSLAPDGRWRVDVRLSRDAARIRDSLNYRSDQLVDLAEIIMRVEVLSADWVLPNDTLSIDDLADPGRFSNIEGGYGFFGAIGYSHTTWSADENAGFCPEVSFPCQN